MHPWLLQAASPSLFINQNNIGPGAFGVALLAGLVSFLSPCVLPLVPAYIGYLSGASLAGDASKTSTRATFSHALAFVLGFTILFVLLGAFVGALSLVFSLMGQGNEGASLAFQLNRALPDFLSRVGFVLLMVLATRVADLTLAGEWRLRLGGSELVWPAQLAGIDQRYLRWLLVGAIAALTYSVFAVDKVGLEKLLLVLLVLILPMAGAGLSATAATVLGLVAAALNTLSWMANSVFSHYMPVDLAGVVLQALAIIWVVRVVSRTTLFYTDKRFELSDRLQNRGYVTSGLMGAVFAAGWSPCVGPNLSVILAMAGSAGQAPAGAALLLTYSLGLGVPFLLVGLMFGQATTLLRRVMRYMPVVKTVNMVLLMLVAVALLSGAFKALSTAKLFDFNL